MQTNKLGIVQIGCLLNFFSFMVLYANNVSFHRKLHINFVINNKKWNNMTQNEQYNNKQIIFKIRKSLWNKNWRTKIYHM